MGVADGPVFAPAKPGSRPITAVPCRCKECIAGPGLDLDDRHMQRMARRLGPLTKVVTYDFCPGCKDTAITTAVRVDGRWQNECPHGHAWTTDD